LTYFVYYYRKDSTFSKLGAFYLKKIERKLEFLAVILMVDCERVIPKDIPNCIVKNADLDNFPRIKLLVPPLFKFDQKNRLMNSHDEIDFNEESVSEEIILKFIKKNLMSFSARLNGDSIHHFLNQPMFNKILLFTDKPETPIIVKGMSNIFYDRILFGEVSRSETDILKRFGITKIPSIIAIENPFLIGNDFKVHYFKSTSDSDTQRNLFKFIETFALREKNYVKRLEDIKLEKNPIKIITRYNYENFFQLGNEASISSIKQSLKYVYFTNEIANDIKKVPEDLKKFASLTNGYSDLGLFSCKSNKKLCRNIFKVDTDKLPALYEFDPSNKDEMMMKNKIIEKSYNKLLNHFANKVPSNVIKTGNEELFDLINQDREKQKYPLIYVHKVCIQFINFFRMKPN
jgi:hypothetical protein